jgi:hypothetical protein
MWLRPQLRQPSKVHGNPSRLILRQQPPLIVAQELYVLDGCVFPLPKFGLRLTHAATTCGSICGKALVACFR